MFKGLFGSKGPKLKRMQFEDLQQAVAIIAQTDSDDAEEAEEQFLKDGFANLFALHDHGQMVGLTGYSLDADAPGIAWLSWTYLDKAAQGQGLGQFMINEMLGLLNQQGVRKIFIDTSDYADQFGRKPYADAHRLYESFGAAVEMTIPHYFDRDEAKLVYGLTNPEAPVGMPSPPASTGHLGLRLTGLLDAPESDDGAAIAWDEAEMGGIHGMEEMISEARRDRARFVLLILPQDLSDAVHIDLASHDFTEAGRLTDYYEPGLQQVWWIRHLEA